MKLKIKKVISSMLLCTCMIHKSFGQSEKQRGLFNDTLQHIKQNIQQNISNIKTGIKDSILSVNPLNKIKETSGLVLNQEKSLQQLISAKINLFNNTSPFKLNHLISNTDFSYSGDTTQLVLFPYQTKIIWSFYASLDLSMFNIPFVLNYEVNNGIYTFGHSPFNSFDQFNFDPARYREQLQSLILQKIKPEVVLSSIMSRINQIKAAYESNLKKEVSDLVKQYADQYKQELKLPSNITDLSVNDLASVKTKLLSSANLDQYNVNIARSQELLNMQTSPLDLTDSAKQMALAEVKKVEVLKTVYNKIESAKARFDDNKIVRELRSHLPFTPANFKSYLQNSDNLIKVIHDYASLSSLQSLFLNITKLDVGKNAVNTGSLSLQNLVNNGINTAFKNEKIGLGLIYGANANTNNWLQSGLSSFVSNEYSHMSGITLTNGNKSKSDQFISMNFFDFRSDPQLSNTGELLQSSYLAQGQRKDAVVTVHSGFPIAPKSKVTIDLSRSFGSYNQFNTLDSITHNPNAVKSLFSSAGTDNYAASLDFDGEVLHTPLQLHISKTGLGYNNPGNVFLRRGETQVGGSIKRRLLKQKLSLQYSTDYRDQSFDSEGIYNFHTFSNKFKTTYRMNRYSNVGFNFYNSNYTSINQTTKRDKGINRRVELQGAYRFKLFDQLITNNDNISHQVMSIPDVTGTSYDSRSYLLVHSSSLILKNNLLSLSVMANRSSNDSYYFNTSSFNMDLSYFYSVANGVRMGSGAGYYDNSGWNRQIGVIQQISLSFNRLNFNVNANYKKAVYVVRKDLANQLFVITSLHYQFN